MSIMKKVKNAGRITAGITMEAAGHSAWIVGECLQKAADLAHSAGAKSLSKADSLYEDAGLERRPWEEVKIRLYRRLADEVGVNTPPAEPEPAVG